MSGAIDVTKTFRGEGEDMIAALIAASGAKPARETTTTSTGKKSKGGDGAEAFDVDGEVVKEKRSFERELVPFDFGDGGGVSIAEASNGAAAAAAVTKKSAPAPKTASAGGKTPPKPKTQGKKTSNKSIPRPKNDLDQISRANQVFEPQQSTLTPEEKAAMFVDAAPSGGGKKKKNKRITEAAKANAPTNDRHWANSSFQNAPAADQLPMPSFLKDVAAPPAPRASSPAPPRAPPTPTPTSAQDLKILLGVKTNPPPQMCAVPMQPMQPQTQAKGHALFNNILNSANGSGNVAAPPPMMMPPTPQPQGVQQKLNTLFGVASQPPQPFPVPQPYPVAPETSGGNFQNLMAKLNAGRV